MPDSLPPPFQTLDEPVASASGELTARATGLAAREQRRLSSDHASRWAALDMVAYAILTLSGLTGVLLAEPSWRAGPALVAVFGAWWLFNAVRNARDVVQATEGDLAAHAAAAGADPRPVGAASVSLHQTGVLSCSETYAAFIPWADISACSETPEIIVFWAGRGQPIVVPKRWFVLSSSAESFLTSARALLEAGPTTSVALPSGGEQDGSSWQATARTSPDSRFASAMAFGELCHPGHQRLQFFGWLAGVELLGIAAAVQGRDLALIAGYAVVAWWFVLQHLAPLRRARVLSSLALIPGAVAVRHSTCDTTFRVDGEGIWSRCTMTTFFPWSAVVRVSTSFGLRCCVLSDGGMVPLPYGDLGPDERARLDRVLSEHVPRAVA